MAAPLALNWNRLMLGRPRLFESVGAAFVVYFVTARDLDLATRLLIAWNTGTWLYFVLSFFLVSRATSKSIRIRARTTDEGKFAILIFTTLAALAATAAIFAELSVTKDLKGLEKDWHLALAVATIISAWVFIHLTFALHYAHEYFDETKNEEGETFKLRGGIIFPETQDPDYWDFMYFSFIIGVASQTADVSISSKAIRRTSLVHSVLAFFFNSAILALTINIAAGLI
ncbi:MAG: DUF1345 domain-containing protein [Beijerinckiaceae bacterium]